MMPSSTITHRQQRRQRRPLARGCGDVRPAPERVEPLGWGDAPFLTRIASWRLALPFAKYVTHARVGENDVQREVSGFLKTDILERLFDIDPCKGAV